MPEAVLQRMQSLFATDFSAVRVHQGPEAVALGAQAFAHGTDLYFAPGQFSPGTPRGDQLIAHELAHVVQQKTGRARNPFGSGIAVVLDPGLEAEAMRMSLRLPPSSPQPKAPPLIQSFQRPGGRALQLAPNFDDYKSWLDKQAMTTQNRGVLNRRLALAQRAIAYTRDKLFHGAGNIKAQIERSKNYSTKYAIKSYKHHARLNTTLVSGATSENNYFVRAFAAQAITARKTGGGNCDHFAAVSFFYLAERAPVNSGFIYRLGVSNSAGRHAVVVYADADWQPNAAPNTSAYRTAVVVDAWPTHAFAVAWADWTYRMDNPKIKAIYAPQSTGGRERVLRMYRDLIRDSDEYARLQEIRRESALDFQKSREWLADPIETKGRYPVWEDDHPLYEDHPGLPFCFLTTACVTARGLEDDCEELSVLRAFRDGYLVNRPGGEDLIAEYYRVAPWIVQGIQARPEAMEILDAVYGQVGRCVDLVLGGKSEAALQRYAGMVEDLREVFLG